MKRFLIVVAVVLLVGVGAVALLLQRRASLEPYADRWLPGSAPAPGALRVTYLGVSSILFDDGETAILTDGFFTRPGFASTLLTRIAPDGDAIDRALKRAGVQRLAAVYAVHSHYDHAMDSPEVARRTGALVVGSESTANIARGAGLPEERIRVVRLGEPQQYGRFRVTAFPSRHIDHGMAMGTIDQPLTPPARATEYREGGSYALLVEHDGRRLLVQGSAGWVEGALREVKADVIFLGIGVLGRKDRAYQEAYWNQTVAAVGARRAVLIHWDDFFRSLDAPLVPMPSVLDPVDRSMAVLFEKGRATGVEVRLAREFTPLDPFAGLPPAATSPPAAP